MSGSSNGWTRRRRASLFFVVSFACGCQARLPGPIQCEQMVYRAVGRTPAEVSASPLAQRVTDRLVHACLTVPFDHVAVECIQHGYGFLRCTDELAVREPARKRALTQLSEDLAELLPRESGRFFPH